MSTLRFLRWLMLMSALLVIPTHAKTVIQVKNQQGEALKHAVIEIITDANPDTWQVSSTPYIMDQIDKSFVPEVLIVPEKSLVSFPNSDDIRHHVYSFSTAKTFELKLYAGKPKAPITFEQSGIVVLGCNIHDAMVGYIYVTDNSHTYLTNEQGKTNIDLSAQQIKEIKVWHANAAKGTNYRQSFTSFNQQNNNILLEFETLPPVKSDSFEDVFSHAH
ncbi:methylamine utilization protein [Thalassotalea sediminis]|uniref:methylamine utilization protein n=1 Tax=Thalassotalea sediminis TaxID=1759089 RepID=UPI002573D1DC|nr:methylamine utilization protein [Thalassotalea sediminis]